MQPMVVDKRTSKLGFAKRLGKALSDAGIPDDDKRRRWVSKTFGVSIESARKWLVGESMPDTARIEGIAKELGSDASWLLSGNHRPPQQHGVRDEGLEYATHASGWQSKKSNSKLLAALDKAHNTGALTPGLSDSLASIIGAIGSASDH